MEPFTLIEKSASSQPYQLFSDVVKMNSAKSADHDLTYISTLREAYADMIVTAIPLNNLPLRQFAAAGFATCELDTETDSFASWRGYVPPAKRSTNGSLGESISFAKYKYSWNDENFILYIVGYVQYVLKERRGNENILGPSNLTDKLILAMGDWVSSIENVVWVYDGYWRRDSQLWNEVQKASWDKVILDESMKKELTGVANKFFDSKDVYEDLGVPWKRGLLFHGPPGNGKTISIRALMHSLYDRKPFIPTLYVKSAKYTWNIGDIFTQARALAPCMLILEDVETIVTPATRSYFFNEMDGLENNDGLFIVASTNFLDKLDPGLSKRPSRFDRKYLFPIPNEHERTLYCEYWRQKLKPNKLIEFPKKLCGAMARITPGFSFAFLQECFVATLLVLARLGEDALEQNEARPFDSDNDDLEDYKLWVTFKKQADILRKEFESEPSKHSPFIEWCKRGETSMSAVSRRGETGETPCCNCQDHQKHRNGLNGSLTAAFAELQVQGEVLPDLPYGSRKERIINSKAYELI